MPQRVISAAIGLLTMVCASPVTAIEPPSLADAVAAGTLPPLAKRLPATPRRDLPDWDGWREGRYGGSIKTLTRTGRDPRDLVVLGYARLMTWEPDAKGGYHLVPDILEKVEVEAGRIFTLYLRPGHRWSDGAPFTAEDFRFWWEAVGTYQTLSPQGLPPALLAGGHAPTFEVLDETTLRFAWPVANSSFLPALAATEPPFIYRPAHYLRQFHLLHRESQALEAEAKIARQPTWAALFEQRDQPYRLSNPDRPTLQPWINTTAPPAERYVGKRNPYFHRVDAKGRQLPYIDSVIIERSQAKLIPAQAAAGETGLQARGLSSADFTLLKNAESRGQIKVRLWPIGRGSQLALYPNLNAADTRWQSILRRPAFRRALSLAIDREAINQALYQGLAAAGANTVLPASPLSCCDRRQRWASYDPDQANALLKAIGLLRVEPDGPRQGPDGETVTLIVESGGADPLEIDVLSLVVENWRAVGIEAVARPTGRQAFRQRVRSGETVMSIFYGLANGLATPNMSPAELAPTDDRQNNWPLWGRHHESGALEGEAPDLPEVQELLALYKTWNQAETQKTRMDVWERMLEIHADQVFTIGLLGEVRQPIVSDARLRNLPDQGYYLFEPGAYLGAYRPDTFWLE